VVNPAWAASASSFLAAAIGCIAVSEIDLAVAGPRCRNPGRESLGDALEISGLALWVAPEKRRISSAAAPRIARALLVQHLGAPKQLVHGLSSDASSSRLRCVAEEGVRTCSIVRRFGAHFEHLVHEQPFLRLAHICRARGARRGAPSLPSMQPSKRERRSCACWQIAGQMRETGKRIFEQQERRRDFERGPPRSCFRGSR